ncbi:hypothetical protein ALC56_10178 [Trachymyrmex septentrionalis]|uniref:Uncharacterized protein n=1 Tax=Trachymyrmex septentrionalis TaxID=34720 RepID=A0A195F583_9HYME|nr:hypothetical protein ALC56_10178 [Trachymyrmex septentrionalis]
MTRAHHYRIITPVTKSVMLRGNDRARVFRASWKGQRIVFRRRGGRRYRTGMTCRSRRNYKGEEKSVGAVEEAGEKSRARERRRDNKRKGTWRAREGQTKTARERVGKDEQGGGKGEEKKKGTWLRDEERDRWMKRGGWGERSEGVRGEGVGKAVPKWKRGKKEKESGPHPKERHDAGRPFASLAFFGAARRGAARAVKAGCKECHDLAQQTSPA